MKRCFDLFFSLLLLALLLPLFLVIMLLVWVNDFNSPFYVAPRMARNNGTFRMIKFRSMVIGASKTGVNSSPADDKRITKIGKFIRKYKFDELPQLINVFKGEMSFVGPRPQIRKEVEFFTFEERKILFAKPGITDFASIVFADEGEILKGSTNPDILYNQIIRPWKSRLALIYVQKSSIKTDIIIIYLTFLNFFNRQKVLMKIKLLLKRWNCEKNLLEIVNRDQVLYPYPPPGTNEIIESY